MTRPGLRPPSACFPPGSHSHCKRSSPRRQAASLFRGRTFTLGDRIVMGGVRGDVIALSFMQTTILEVGQPPPVQSDSPAMWIRSRHYTGRIVPVSNSKVFDEPVYNYSRKLPLSSEEVK